MRTSYQLQPAGLPDDLWDFPGDPGGLPTQVKALRRVVRRAAGGHPGAVDLLALLLPDLERLLGAAEAVLRGGAGRGAGGPRGTPRAAPDRSFTCPACGHGAAYRAEECRLVIRFEPDDRVKPDRMKPARYRLVRCPGCGKGCQVPERSG
jgi:hypothetical protein